MKALALLLLASPLAAQTSDLPLQAYADSVLAITKLTIQQQRHLDYLSTGSEAREMVVRLAALTPPSTVTERHAQLVDRARRWAQSVAKVARPPRTGLEACLGPSSAASSDCRSANMPGFTDRQDASNRLMRFQVVRRELLRQLRDAGAQVSPAA